MEVAPFADRGVDRSVYYQGTQEIGTIRVLQELLQPGDWFIDVGANIGVLSLVGAQAVGSQGSVWAFEPNPASFAFLKTNIELNNATQVRLFPIAVGAGLGSARIRYASFYKAGATLKPGTSPEEGIEVPVDSLDSLVGRECTQRYPKVIKVDVEGWEYEVVRGQARC
jgi:FkbM family methyltransferase